MADLTTRQLIAMTCNLGLGEGINMSLVSKYMFPYMGNTMEALQKF